MADWEAFATAFLKDTAGYINDRKDKAEDYKDRLLEDAERNKGKLKKLRAAANAQQGFISQARGLYATDAQIEAALDSGPTGLQSLVADLNAQKTKYGNDYTESFVQDYAKLPETFKATGNIDPMARYGLTGAVVGDVDAPRGGFLSRAFGMDAKARARAEMDAQEFGGTGLSVYDLSTISDVAGYESLNPTSFLAYTAPKLLAESEVPNEIDDLNVAVRTIQGNADRQYDMALQTIEAGVYAKDEDGITAKKEAQVLAAKQRDAAINRGIQNFVSARRALYDNYDRYMASTLEGLGLTSMLIEDDTSPSKTMPNLQDQMNFTFGADPSSQDSTTIATDSEVVTGRDPSALETPAAPEFTGDFNQLVREIAEKKEVDMNATGARARAAQLEVYESAYKTTMANYTFDEWKKMSRKERKEKGLPESRMDGALGTGDLVFSQNFKPAPPKEEEVREPSESQAGASRLLGVSPEKMQEVIEQGFVMNNGQRVDVTEMDVNLLANHGEDIAKFLKDGNYSTDTYGILEGLDDWAKNNKKQLPFDTNFLIRTFKAALGAN